MINITGIMQENASATSKMKKVFATSRWKLQHNTRPRHYVVKELWLDKKTKT